MQRHDSTGPEWRQVDEETWVCVTFFGGQLKLHLQERKTGLRRFRKAATSQRRLASRTCNCESLPRSTGHLNRQINNRDAHPEASRQ